MSNRPIFDAIINLDGAIRKHTAGQPIEFYIQLPYNIRQLLIVEGQRMSPYSDNLRGRDWFTIMQHIHIEPTKDETEQKLRDKVERAKRLYEEAQKEYNAIIGETNG